MPKTFSHTILDKINKKAEAMFPLDLLRSPASEGEHPLVRGPSREDFDENYELYLNQWFRAAEEVYKEFEDEGLIVTAAEVRKIIDSQRRVTNV